MEGVTVNPAVVEPSRARTNCAQTHSIWSPVSAMNGRPFEPTPMIGSTLTRACAAICGRLMPNEPKSVPMFPSRTLTSVQSPPELQPSAEWSAHGLPPSVQSSAVGFVAFTATVTFD